MDIYRMSGRALVEFIRRSHDFDLSRAVEINRMAWSDEQSPRHRKFTSIGAEPDIVAFFESNERLIRGPLLDIGCAGGHNLAFFQGHGAKPLYGLDISCSFVEKAKETVPDADICIGDMHSLPYDDKGFKTIIARGAFHVTTTQGFLIALKEAYRVLADGGLLYLFMRDVPSLDEIGKIEQAGLFTFIRYGPFSQQGNGPSIELVRNYIPQAQLELLLKVQGFSILDTSPGPVGPPKDSLSNRPGLSYHCKKGAPF